jgi:hypothetical protein
VGVQDGPISYRCGEKRHGSFVRSMRWPVPTTASTQSGLGMTAETACSSTTGRASGAGPGWASCVVSRTGRTSTRAAISEPASTRALPGSPSDGPLCAARTGAAASRGSIAARREAAAALPCGPAWPASLSRPSALPLRARASTFHVPTLSLLRQAKGIVFPKNVFHAVKLLLNSLVSRARKRGTLGAACPTGTASSAVRACTAPPGR